MNALRRLFRQEEGGVIAIVAIALPMMLGFATLVIDTGNWWVHKKHLQTQADAAALAAAGDVHFGCDPATTAPIIRTTVQKYSGGTYNAQVGNANKGAVYSQLNQADYYQQPGNPGDTKPDGQPLNGNPCLDKLIDVKMTEKGLPWLMSKLHIVPNINAQARVEFQGVSQMDGMLPIGVKDVRPKRVAIELVDEANGSARLDLKDLSKSTTSGGLVFWTNAGDPPLVLNAGGTRIGVRVHLSSNDTNIECGTKGVLCYDGAANGSLAGPGIGFIRRFSTPSVPADGAPRVGDARLTPGLDATKACGDGWFSARAIDCTLGMTADIRLQSGLSSGKVTINGEYNDPATGALQTFCLVPGTSAGSQWLSWDCHGPTPAGPNPQDAITLPAGLASLSVRLAYTQEAGKVNGVACGNGNGQNPKPCTGSLEGGQTIVRSWSADDDRSGPVKSVSVCERSYAGSPPLQTACSSGANSLAATASHDLTVTIGLSGSLAMAQKTDPPVTMRLGTGTSGSQNGTVDCDPVVKLRDEIVNGCTSPYEVNTTGICPDPLPNPPSARTCVPTEPGDKTGQIAQALDERILRGANTCVSPNHWSDYPNFPLDDPRVMPAFVVPLDAFTGNGASSSQNVPVIDFAAFYITGWIGQGNNPCSAKSNGGDDPINFKGKGYVVGHFIKPIAPSNEHGGDGTPCNFTSPVGACVGVLTR